MAAHDTPEKRIARARLDVGLRNSLANAQARRAQLLQGVQAPVIRTDRMNDALARRDAKLPDIGDLPVLASTTRPRANGTNGNGIGL